MRPQPTNRRSIYVGLVISLLGIAVLALALWVLDFGLAVKLAGVVVGSALVYGGWRVTERGRLEEAFSYQAKLAGAFGLRPL